MVNFPVDDVVLSRVTVNVNDQIERANRTVALHAGLANLSTHAGS